MKKIYQSRLTYYSMCIALPDGCKHVEFKGGSFSSGITSPSQFITEDEEIMAAIEKTQAFEKRKVWLYSTEGKPTINLDAAPINKVKFENPDVLNPKETELPKIEAPADVKTDAPKPEATQYPVIKNCQQAKEKLIELGYAIEFVATKDVVIALAKANNISFPDWKAFNEA